MTDHPSPLDAHVASLGAALRDDQARRQARARRRRRGLLLASPIVAGACLAIAFWPGERTDVLARASAALTPTTTVVHFRVIARSNATERGACDDSRAGDDVWLQTTGDTPRWRWRQPQLGERCGIVVTGLGHRAVGPTDTAYDGRALTTSSPQGGWVERFTDPSPSARSVPDVARLGGISRNGRSSRPEDPVRFVQGLLEERRLRVTRRGTARGRDVFWLEGTDVQRSRVRVAIDASTYVPVTVIRELPISDFVRMNPELRATTGSEQRIDFERYETASTSDLDPELPPSPRTVTEMDWADAMAAMDARRRAESRAGHLRALRMQRERSSRRP